MTIKVSLILPSLNVVKYIKQCLDSVLRQTLPEIEILCIDADSSDGTKEVLQEYEKLDERIRVIISPYKSYGYQVNLGISKARGEYVGIIETDDYVDTHMCEYLYQMAKTYEADVVHSEAVFISGAGGFQKQHIFSEKHNDRYYCRFGNTDLLITHLTGVHLWDGLYRNTFLRQRNICCNESKGAAFQDIGFLQQVHTLAESFVYSDKAFYYYRKDRLDSSTNKPGWLKYIKQEWQFLLQGSLTVQQEWTRHKMAVITRLVQTFIYELGRSFGASGCSCMNTEWYYEYLWLREHTIQCVSDGMVIEAWLSVDERRKLWLLVNTENGFFDMLKLENCFPKYESDMLLHWADEPSVIFGCGALGKKVYDILLQSGRTVKGFVDNNSELWGTEYDGIKIYPPEDLNSCLNDFSVIVCNVYYSEEICSQLRRLGINEAKIHVYSPNGVR